MFLGLFFLQKKQPAVTEILIVLGIILFCFKFLNRHFRSRPLLIKRYIF
jgi:membrane-bound ClpP family serine protease